MLRHQSNAYVLGYETPGEAHTLVAYAHDEPMKVHFNVTGPLIWLDNDGEPEVAIVHDGAATFFLGAQQARIVRRGQVVRVPACVPHRWVATGDRRLRAVAVHSAAEILTSPA